MNPSRNVWTTASVALLFTLLLLLFQTMSPAPHLIDLKGRDLFFRLQHHFSVKPKLAKDIVLVILDDGTLKRLSARWPYPRSVYAEALKRLEPFSPKAVGFDFVFSGEDFSSENDQSFAEALREAGNVVIAAHWSIEGEVGPSSLLGKSAWRVGVVDKPRDRDRMLRRAYFDFPVAGQTYRSWELELFQKAFSEEAARSFPMKGTMVINYQLRFNEFTRIPLWELLDGKVSREQIENKIVLIGLTSEAFHDIHATPFGSMPGLAVNANTLLTMMTRTFFTFVSRWAVLGLAFLALWLTLMAAMSGALLSGLLVILSLIAIYLGTSFLLFSHQLILDLWFVVLAVAIVFLGSIIFRESQLFLENLRLREESSRDPLTGFYSRRFLELKLKSEMNHIMAPHGGARQVKEVSVVMIDLDNFKLVNDSFGHAEGDRVLRTMAEAIHASVRKEELICRFGGDEFCVILVNTSIQNAAKFAEKLRALVAENPKLVYRTASGVDTIRVTASIGVASVTGAGATDALKLLKAADRALYRAKRAGRNQVCVFDAERDVIE